jgi:L-asparaginase/Glu-tRNA(Gln) amidotransferase subunit D
LFPGFTVNQIESAIAWGVKGIILRGYGSGNISYEYLAAVRFAFKKNIPVVVDTQCLEGVTLMHLYDVGRHARNPSLHSRKLPSGRKLPLRHLPGISN